MKELQDFVSWLEQSRIDEESADMLGITDMFVLAKLIQRIMTYLDVTVRKAAYQPG